MCGATSHSVHLAGLGRAHEGLVWQVSQLSLEWLVWGARRPDSWPGVACHFVTSEGATTSSVLACLPSRQVPSRTSAIRYKCRQVRSVPPCSAARALNASKHQRTFLVRRVAEVYEAQASWHGLFLLLLTQARHIPSASQSRIAHVQYLAARAHTHSHSLTYSPTRSHFSISSSLMTTH